VTAVQDVDIPLSDGSSLPAALAIGSEGSQDPRIEPSRVTADGARSGVIVLHETLGLNDDIRRICRRFADSGYVALAPDFLAGLGPKPFCIARFARGVGKPGVGRPYRQLEAARAWLAARREVDGRPIGVAGFCIGGGFALLYAAGGDVEVVAPFYAAAPKDDAVLAAVCPVVASYGGRDAIFGPHAARLDATLSRLGIDHDVATYAEAGHSFMNRHGPWTARIERRLPTHGGFDPAAAEAAWARTLTFFRRYLAPS
jgi:carboxymethylenebutenolidase